MNSVLYSMVNSLKKAYDGDNGWNTSKWWDFYKRDVESEAEQSLSVLKTIFETYMKKFSVVKARYRQVISKLANTMEFTDEIDIDKSIVIVDPVSACVGTYGLVYTYELTSSQITFTFESVTGSTLTDIYFNVQIIEFR